MGKSSLVRVTIVLEEDLILDLRRLQSRIIRETGKNCSFSSIVSIVAAYGSKSITKRKAILELGLKHEKRKTK